MIGGERGGYPARVGGSHGDFEREKGRGARVVVPGCLAAWLRSRVLGSLTAALVVVSAAASLRGQTGCGIGTDGLDPHAGNPLARVSCCPPSGNVQANLPSFGMLTMSGQATVFDDCLSAASDVVSIVISAPIVENCDHYRIPFKITGTDWILDASFRAKYARTWMDFDAQGQCRQRWRFLLNADVSFLFDSMNPPLPFEGVIPSCVFSGTNVRPHYTGHLDYICVGGTDGLYAAAFELHHLPGCISHASCAQAPANMVPPALQHPNASYHIAGPSPFSFADPGVSPGGPGFLFPFVMNGNSGDTLRESRFPWSAYACLNESGLVRNKQNNTFGDQLGGEFCMCAAGSTVPISRRRYVYAGLNALYDCPEYSSAALTVDENPFGYCMGALGPFSVGTPGLIVMRVGGWSGGLFDGEYVHVIFGRVRHDRYHERIDPLPPNVGSCGTLPVDPLLPNETESTFVHGVGTRYTGGQFGRLEPFANPLLSCGVYASPRYDRFVDMANMFIIDSGTPQDIDGYGREFYSWAVWSLNPNAF